MTRRRRAARRADPLVPIFSPNLRAAIQNQKLSVAGAASHMGESQQTLAHLVTGDGTKRCRHSRRAKLARMLQVSEEFLSQPTVQVLPVYPPGDQAAAITGILSFDSPRVQLAYSRLLLRCVEACDRDFADPALGNVADQQSEREAMRNNLARCIRTLADIDDWRHAILVGEESPFWGFVFDGTMIRSRTLPTDPDEEAGRLSLIGGWEQLLEPWFAGKAKLNYRALRVRAGFGPTDDGRSETDPRIMLGIEKPLREAM